jgi:putative flippase GtrA
VRRVVDVVNRTLSGKLNVTLPVTLQNGNTTTTIIDPRITAYSALLLTPLTAHAAAIAASVYVSSQQNGQATFTHSNTANTDQLFRLCIIG